ncbi:hypothetical protein SLEP1_g26230 [Rubroshorea leprosula]|uniref:Uncharacterized protein n=1 Tax=Rubroshorea leprosula TaxID=152421 RepID=A0AAV5JSN6_9ROSI|nr:hypothetical protein SLEP1_g26230 [Rubroshorea leprosula]
MFTANKKLDAGVSSINLDLSQFNGSLHNGKDETDSNCRTSPNEMDL